MADFTLHPRALIRHAVVRVLKENPLTATLLGDRVYPNRTEHWLAEELPACGVYTLSEETINSDTSPDPDERRIDLIVELLARMTDTVDNTLDALTLAVEKALRLDAIGDVMGRIVNESLIAASLLPKEKVKKDGEWRWPADTLLLLGLKSTDIGIAVDGNRQIGVAAMNFDLEYQTPREEIPLPDFLLAIAGWDVMPADGLIDMVSRVEFDPASVSASAPAGGTDATATKPPAPAHVAQGADALTPSVKEENSIPDSASKQIDLALKE